VIELKMSQSLEVKKRSNLMCIPYSSELVPLPSAGFPIFRFYNWCVVY
jgi:hypothetical protein